MHWSSQQDAALLAVSAWLKEPSAPQVFRLFGWAGTGKSTLAVHLAQDAGRVVYAAFTGKAALVMRRRGCAGAQTIHSLIYKLLDEQGGEPRFVLDHGSAIADCDLVVIDEVSMVNEELGKDLLSFNKKVLVLGDPFQLPPVSGTGFFTAHEPDVMLTEIHRQAADNPIIQMSVRIREGKGLEFGTYGESKVIHSSEVDRSEVLEADQLLVGRNITRTTYNNRVRELLKRPSPLPVPDDRLVCLRNNREKGLLNGQIFNTKKVTLKGRGGIWMLLDPSDAGARVDDVAVFTHEKFFQGKEEELTWGERKRFDEFNFGYALTVHKSQGSQWDNVYLFDESNVFREDRDRWLYTGVTRAAERITVVA